MLVTLLRSGLTEVEKLVHSSPPQIPRKPTDNSQKTSLFCMSVNLPNNQLGFRCNVLEIWISRFVYLENNAIFASRGNSYFRLAIEGL